MKPIDLLITAGWILPIVPSDTLYTDYGIAIKQARIVDLLPAQQAQQRYQAAEHIHLHEHILIPGLINAHTHSPMNLFRGLADDLKLMDWLQQHLWPAEAALIDEHSTAIGSQLAIAEMLRGGTTCFNDHYMFPHVTANTVEQTGIRACLGWQLMDEPTQWAKNGTAAIERAVKLHHERHPHPRITWAWAPHAPYTVDNDTFKKLKNINQDWQLPIHIHLHETEEEVHQSIAQYGCRPIERLQHLGLLSSKTIAVHMLALTEQDISILKSTGMSVVHCPESNLKLASGIAPISTLLKAGINVALGTDSAASNNNLDMFGEMQTAALLAKVELNDPTAIPSHQVLAMASINGAKALGLEHSIGSLEVGKAADIVAIDTSSYYTQPLYHPESHLIYATNALQVSDVWVDGKQLLNKGQLTTIDTDALLNEVSIWVKKARRFC